MDSFHLNDNTNTGYGCQSQWYITQVFFRVKVERGYLFVFFNEINVS